MVKPTIWVFCIEPLTSRYTSEWYTHFPKLLRDNFGDKFDVCQVDGTQRNTAVTPGAFLNFSDTNYWKSTQLCNFLDMHNEGKTTANDHIIYTDAWNPTVIQLKYMNDLMELNWTFHGLWHSGNYDSADFLGRLGKRDWISHAEKSMFDAFDHNYFATDFHIELFAESHASDYEYRFDWAYDRQKKGKIVKTGWPMEYMPDILAPYKNVPKRDLILFPHRIAPEKQVEIFRDLALALPQYEFVVCQDKKLTKHEYHTLIAESKIVFSCSLQETLGISPLEGSVLGSYPLLPDRLSYSEMYTDEYLYPSVWTESYEAYTKYKAPLIARITHIMANYDTLRADVVNVVAPVLMDNFFTATNLINQLRK